MATAAVPEVAWSRRSVSRGGEVLAIGAAGVVATALTAWAVAQSPILVDPTGSSIARSAFVAAYAAVGTSEFPARSA